MTVQSTQAGRQTRGRKTDRWCVANRLLEREQQPMAGAAAWWRRSSVQRGGGDTAASGHGLVQVPTPPERTQERRQGKHNHRSANRQLTPECLTGTTAQPVWCHAWSHISGDPAHPTVTAKTWEASNFIEQIRCDALSPLLRFISNISSRKSCQDHPTTPASVTRVQPHSETMSNLKTTLVICKDFCGERIEAVCCRFAHPQHSEPAQPSGCCPALGCSAHTLVIKSPNSLFRWEKTQKEKG